MQPFRNLLATAALMAVATTPALAQPSDREGGALIDEGGSGAQKLDEDRHLNQGGTAPADLPPEFTRPENERQVRALLESQGYSDIQDIQMDGEVITANATRDGQRQEVVIRVKTESQDGG